VNSLSFRSGKGKGPIEDTFSKIVFGHSSLLTKDKALGKAKIDEKVNHVLTRGKLKNKQVNTYGTTQSIKELKKCRNHWKTGLQLDIQTISHALVHNS